MPSPQPQRQAPTPVPAPAPVATTPTKVKADETPAQEPVQKPEAMQEDGGDGDNDKKPWKKNKCTYYIKTFKIKICIYMMTNHCANLKSWIVVL